MEPITAEVADEFIRRLSEGEPLAPALQTADSVPWAEKHPLSWPDFIMLLEGYCHARHWQISFDSENDFSLAIFAGEEQVTNGTGLRNEAIQKPLPFEEEADGLPF